MAENAFTVYETSGSRSRLPSDYVRYEHSVMALKDAGISFESVTLDKAGPLSGVDTAKPLSEKDFPISVYCGTVVDSGEYPPDRILVDYLNVPDGVLSVNMTSFPLPGDSEQPCNIRPRFIGPL